MGVFANLILPLSKKKLCLLLRLNATDGGIFFLFQATG